MNTVSLPTYETLIFNVEEKVAYLYLNRPPVNPLGSKLFTELLAALDYIENSNEIKAVILTGQGEKAFAAGADITEMSGLDADGIAKMNRLSRHAFSKLENLSKPVIAAINGLALGGGLELALCCDFRLASENAKLALPEINLAIIPGGGGTQRLPRLIGQARAKELLYFGDMIKAEEALSYGIVNKVVPLEQLLEASKEWASKLVEKPAVALKMMKIAVQTGANTDVNTALDIESACFGNTFTTEDRKEGMLAFVEKRKPAYQDR